MKLTSILRSLKNKGKAYKVIQRHRENKSLFGELLETKQEKVQRTKKEVKLISSQTSDAEEGVAEISYTEDVEIKKPRRRSLYNPVIFPRVESVRLEHAAVSVKKNRITVDSAKDNDESRIYIHKDETIKAKHKVAEIEWAMKFSPTKMKLIDISLHDKGQELSPDEGAGNDTVSRRTNQKEVDAKSGASKAVRNKFKTIEAEMNSMGFLPYFNPKRNSTGEDNVGKEEVELVSENDGPERGESTAIISFPFPFTIHRGVDDNVGAASQNKAREENIVVMSGAAHQSSVVKESTLSAGASPKLPSVSKILNATMPEQQAQALKRWEQKMIAQMGEQGFRKYKEKILSNGKSLHGNIECYLRGKSIEEIQVEESNQGHWNSLSGVLASVDHVHVVESHVIHPELQYCGVVDCVAEFRNRLVLIDWKTSQKPKPIVAMTYDTPLQIAAYVGAINYDPRYSFKINDGLIVIAYEDGSSSQTFQLNSVDIAKYWKQWLSRLQIFRQMNPQL